MKSATFFEHFKDEAYKPALYGLEIFIAVSLILTAKALMEGNNNMKTVSDLSVITLLGAGVYQVAKAGYKTLSDAPLSTQQEVPSAGVNLR